MTNSNLPDSISYDSLGGNKVDIIDVMYPSAERSADEVNNALINVAEMTRTADRGWVRFIMTIPPVLATPTSYEFVWKGATASAPTFTRLGAGLYTITLPTTVNDEGGTSHTVNLKVAHANIEGNFGFISCSITAANVIQVSAANIAGTPSDIGASTVSVFFK